MAKTDKGRDRQQYLHRTGYGVSRPSLSIISPGRDMASFRFYFPLAFLLPLPSGRAGVEMAQPNLRGGLIAR